MKQDSSLLKKLNADSYSIKRWLTSRCVNYAPNIHTYDYSKPIRCRGMYRLQQTMSHWFPQIRQPLPMLAWLRPRLAMWWLCCRARLTYRGLIMNQLPLTKKESQVLDDVLNYMIDYMQDRVWSTQDRLAFDRIYSKNKSLKYWNAGVPSISWEF